MLIIRNKCSPVCTLPIRKDQYITAAPKLKSNREVSNTEETDGAVWWGSIWLMALWLFIKMGWYLGHQETFDEVTPTWEEPGHENVKKPKPFQVWCLRERQSRWITPRQWLSQSQVLQMLHSKSLQMVSDHGDAKGHKGSLLVQQLQQGKWSRAATEVHETAALCAPFRTGYMLQALFRHISNQTGSS